MCIRANSNGVAPCRLTPRVLRFPVPRQKYSRSVGKAPFVFGYVIAEGIT